MLPFLKHKQAQSAGLIVKTRAPDEKPEENQEDPSAAIEACSQALINAVHAKDAKAVSEALKDAFDILESMPEDESVESTSKHDYDAQNIKAAE